MGLDNREGGNYITILAGKFCQRVPAGTEGAVERINKIGNTVHEKFYDSFTGKLIDIKVRDGEYGKTWNFVFQDKKEPYTLQLSYSNSFSTAFLKMLPNIDLTKDMKLSPSVKEVDGKNKSSLFINQNGKALKHAYTREVPNGMPDMEQVQVNGQMVWDDSKRLAFLQNMVDTTIIPKLPKQQPPQVAVATPPPVAETPVATPAVVATPTGATPPVAGIATTPTGATPEAEIDPKNIPLPSEPPAGAVEKQSDY